MEEIENHSLRIRRGASSKTKVAPDEKEWIPSQPFEFTHASNGSAQPPLLMDDEQPKFLTGWVPVVKIFTTKNRAVRTLWALFTVCMVIALVSSITVVVHRYLSYVTVVRLDERGPQDDIPPPAVTICLVEHELPNLNVEKLKRIGQHNWNIIQGATKHCDEDNVVTWNSENDSVSPIYGHSAHMVVTFATDPVVCFTLNVLEQVPAPPSSICTTFEIVPRFPKNTSFWKMLRVQVKLLEENRTMLGRPSIIVHDQNSIPLNKLARSINEFITPGTGVSLFYNKEITKRLSTRSSPCNFHPVHIMDHAYKYDRVACQWRFVCQHYHANCQCLCPLEMLRRHLDDRVWHVSNMSELSLTTPIQTNCPARCHHNYPIALVNSTACPQACLAVTYKCINRFVDDSGHRGQFALYLIQPEGLTEMIEEELYSLPKLFSEIGGLSSFCFGFSCILFFEVFELAFWLRCTYRSQFNNQLNDYLSREVELTDAGQSVGRSGTNTDTRNNRNDHLSDASIHDLNFEDKLHAESVNDEISVETKSLKGQKPPTSAKHTSNWFSSAFQSSHHIVFNPMRVCRVDGTRLSQYPSDNNSPILGLKKIQQPQSIRTRTPDQSIDSRSQYVQVSIQLEGEVFTLPLELIHEIQ